MRLHVESKRKLSAFPVPAKVIRPVPNSVYSQTRLFKWLDNARAFPLIWIVGPPGAGKTTLIADYLARRNLGALWYQADPGDEDIATFFHYMDLAAHGAKTVGRKKITLPRLTPDCLPALSNFTRRYFQALYARFTTSFAVVIDNYQEVASDARLHEVVRDSLDQLPRGANVIVISRNDPPPTFARLRVNGMMTFLGWNELRLTLDEAQGVVARGGRKKLTADALRSLHERTQGWIAGLVLMADQLDSEYTDEPPQLAAPQLLFDYFAGEVFQKMDARTQKMLLQSAFLPRMTPRMVTLLSGERGAGRVLSELNRRNYFTENHARSEPVYQYHPLLREFLISRARASLPHEGVRDIQRRAASLLEKSGQYEDAIELFTQIGDSDGIARVILNRAAAMVAQGRNQTLEAWIDQLPKNTIEQTPWLLYWLGVCRVPFNPPAGREYFERAFSRFKAHNDLPGIFMAWSGVVEAIVHGYTELELLDDWVTTLESLLREHTVFPSREIEARVSCNMLLALVFRQLHHPQITSWVERANRLADQVDDDMLKLFTLGYSTLYYLWTGDLAKAAAMLDRLHKSLNPDTRSPLIQIGAYVIASIHQLYRTTRVAELKFVNEGLAIAAATDVHIWDGVLLSQGAGMALSVGDLTLADQLLHRMRDTLNDSRRMDVCLFHFFSAWAALLKGDVDATITHGESALSLAVEAGSVNVEERCHLLVGQMLHRRGEREAAWDHVDRARRSMRRRGDRLTEFMGGLIEAEFLLEERRDPEALATLRRAMRLGAEQGYVNFYAWQPQAMARLCAVALEAGIETAYIQRLVRERGLLPEAAAFDCVHWPWPVKFYTLGRFTIVKEDKPLLFSGKTQEKPLELLKALIAFGGRDVAEGRLIEALWPDTEGDAAHRALHTTLHRLRKLIGIDRAVVVQAHKLTLDRQLCWVDAWVFERILGRIESAIQRPVKETTENLIRWVAQIFEVYRGLFLGPDAEQGWAVSMRERLHDKFQRLLSALGAYWEETGQWTQLVTHYQQAIDIDDLSEEFYQRLMRGYRQLGQRTEALSAYKRCQRVLRAALGAVPSPETEAIRTSLGHAE